MLLLVQVLGVLLAGLFVWLLARGGELRGRAAAATVAVIVVIVALLLIPPQLRSSISRFVDLRDYADGISAEGGRELPGTTVQADTGFIDWAGEHIGEDEPFQLVVGHFQVNSLIFQWALFRLEPREGILQPAAGGWVVFYDVPPSRYRRPHFREVQVYKPGYAIARYAP